MENDIKNNMKNDMKNDMKDNIQKDKNAGILEGNISRALFAFAIPIAFSAMLQQLFTAADQAVVGQFAGSTALAAVGANTSLVGLLVNVFSSISVGTNAQIALAIGSGNRKNITRIVHTSVTFAFLAGLFMCGVTQFIAFPVHSLLGTPEEVIDQAAVYLRIYSCGFPFFLLYNFGSAVLRSKGDTKRPMYALVSAGVLNVILNLVFVIGFHLGVAGVAISTAVSNVVSSGCVLFFLTRERDETKLQVRDLGIDPKSLLAIIQIGGPAAIQSAVFSLANVSIQSGINSLGKDAMAGSAAAQNLEYISYFICNSFGQALTTFCGQNYGARNMKRCKQVIRVAYVENFCCMFFYDVMVNILRQPLIGIFSSDPGVAKFAYVRLMIVIGFHWMILSYELLAASMRGMGYALMPALLTILGCVCFRVTWLFTVFKLFHTFACLMAVYPASWVVTGSLVFGYYMSKRKALGFTSNRGEQ